MNKTSRTFDIAAHVVEMLNKRLKNKADIAIQTELRRLVTLWLESGPHTGKLMREHPDLIPQQVPCFLVPKTSFSVPKAGEKPVASSSGLEVSFLPAATVGKQPSPKASAMVLFLQLLTSPDAWRVAGPCECGCDQFIVQKGRYHKTYITGHASRKSASEAMSRKHAAKRAPRIRAVNRALAKYRGPREHGDWKDFVEVEVDDASRGKITVTVYRLEEWARKGWIQAPETFADKENKRQKRR